MKTKRTYEIEMVVDASVAIAAVRQGKDGSQLVEEILSRDPAVAEVIREHREAEPLPDYDPRQSGKIPA